jgi:polyribonucleotide nucleotidyltransferase
MILDVTREVELGKIYEAKVVKVEDFGCFVQLWPGCEGLVHISQLSNERVEKTEDVVKVGDTIVVKAIGPDKKGRQNFSMKEALSKSKKK